MAAYGALGAALEATAKSVASMPNEFSASRFLSWGICLWMLAVLVASNTATMADEVAEDPRFEKMRQSMVRDQISHPRDRRPPVRDARVLKAMQNVPRHHFVNDDDRDRAYQDRPLRIGHGQTISQPYIVAYMTELLELQSEHKVLEIGTGSGYQAAVLAELVASVLTIEIVQPLAQRATAVLRELGYENVQVRAGDGYLGWPEQAPFDRIIVTAAPDHVPQPLIDQLKIGGRLVLPVGPSWMTQELTVIVKQADGSVHRASVMPVGFVPMTRE